MQLETISRHDFNERMTLDRDQIYTTARAQLADERLHHGNDPRTIGLTGEDPVKGNDRIRAIGGGSGFAYPGGCSLAALTEGVASRCGYLQKERAEWAYRTTAADLDTG